MVEREQKPSRLERLRAVNNLSVKARERILYSSFGVCMGSLAAPYLFGEKYAPLILATATFSAYAVVRHILKEATQ